jgi:alkylation response protein AidB-like acyl-CoA dehydrogenase
LWVPHTGCKYLLTEACNRVSFDALQIHGGAGYMKEFKVERSP